MASLYIKDADTNARVTRLAQRLGVSKTEAVRRAVRALENVSDEERIDRARDWLADFYTRFPPPEPSGTPADKAFFDDLSGNL